jgi:hypothetical protein
MNTTSVGKLLITWPEQSVTVICMLQVPSSLPPCVPSLGGLVPATKVVIAHAKSKQLNVVLTSLVFICVIFFHCFGLSCLPTVPPSFRTRGLLRAKGRSFPAVQGSTPQDLAVRYAESKKTSEHRLLGWYGSGNGVCSEMILAAQRKRTSSTVNLRESQRYTRQSARVAILQEPKGISRHASAGG